MSSPSSLFGDPRLPDRFWIKVTITETGCWEWTGSGNTHGYGQIRLDGHTQHVHRVAWSALVHPLPAPGAGTRPLQIDHLCRVRRCCNPAHMELVTARENVLRGQSLQAANARLTHCKNGHPFDGDNLRLTTQGKRECRTCARAKNDARNALLRAARQNLGLTVEQYRTTYGSSADVARRIVEAHA